MLAARGDRDRRLEKEALAFLTADQDLAAGLFDLGDVLTDLFLAPFVD